MRAIRFELSPESVQKMGLPSGFLHVSWERTEDSGFDGLREVLQGFQQHRLPSPRSLKLIASDWKWFVRAVWYRFIFKAVLPPSKIKYQVHLVMEQAPTDANALGLSKTQKDALEEPKLVVEWDISEQDQKSFVKLAEFATRSWRESEISEIARIIPDNNFGIGHSVAFGAGIFHPCGTTSIGVNPEQGVLDSNLKVYGVERLWAVSTAALPRLGAASPSMAALQLGLHVVKNILESHKNGGERASG